MFFPWEKAFLNGECNEIQSRFWNPKPVEELYDTENDPWEINNLATDPAYSSVLKRMRKANRDWLIKIKETGFVPEADRDNLLGETAIYDYFQSDKVDIETIIDAAEIATLDKEENLPLIKGYLKSENNAIRYWGATGLLILGEKAKSAIPELKEAIKDESLNVVVVASEALYKLGEKQEAQNGIIKVLDANHQFASTHALNAIAMIGMDSPEI